jgi:hypothetical protein
LTDFRGRDEQILLVKLILCLERNHRHAWPLRVGVFSVCTTLEPAADIHRNKMAQSGDVSAGRVPGDSISSLSMNGTLELYPTLLVAGSWDATVGSFNYDISNVV